MRRKSINKNKMPAGAKDRVALKSIESTKFGVLIRAIASSTPKIGATRRYYGLNCRVNQGNWFEFNLCRKDSVDSVKLEIWEGTLTFLQHGDKIEFAIWGESKNQRIWDNNNGSNYNFVHHPESANPLYIDSVKDGAIIGIEVTPIGWNHRCGITYCVNRGNWSELEFQWKKNTYDQKGEIWEGLIRGVTGGDKIEYAIWAEFSNWKTWNNNHHDNFHYECTNYQYKYVKNKERLKQEGKLIDPKNLFHISGGNNRLEAAKVFSNMLESKTTEHDWQNFFNNNPYVLSDGLRLKLDGLYSQVPLISGRPDYIFTGKSSNSIQGDYGVIELKRPCHSILGSYSTNFIHPSKSLSIATEEIRAHLDALKLGQFQNPEHKFIIGNRKHAFIIIGRSEEIVKKCRNDTLMLRYKDITSNGFNLFTYDDLLKQFREEVPPFIHILNLSSDDDHQTLRFDLVVRNQMGIVEGPAAMIVRLLQKYNCSCRAFKDGEEVNPRSIMGIMMLAAGKGTLVGFEMSGSDARQAMNEMIELWDNKFDQA